MSKFSDDVSWNPDADPRRQVKEPVEKEYDKIREARPILTGIRVEIDNEAYQKVAQRVSDALRRLSIATTTAQGAFQFLQGSWDATDMKKDDNHFRVHAPTQCQGTNCAIHNPSRHGMQLWPREIYALRVWRTCPTHGNRHPDPDDVAYWVRRGKKAGALQEHECCGCCTKQK